MFLFLADEIFYRSYVYPQHFLLPLLASLYLCDAFLSSVFCQIMDVNYFFGSDFTDFSAEPLRSSVPLQWALDLMCEKLRGVSNFLLL